MKIVFVAAGSNVHTARWASGICAEGHQVTIVTRHSKKELWHPKVEIHYFPFWGTPGYLLLALVAKKMIFQLRPDLVHAHFASGYGTVARYINYRPWLLSVYGTDIYEFPKSSPFHRSLIRKNLLEADQIASTSHCMAQKIRTLTPEICEIPITPFGIDLKCFSSIPNPRKAENGLITIGTVKHMSDRYGIDILLQAFSILVFRMQNKKKVKATNLCLRLVGEGPETKRYKDSARRLGITNRVKFVGRVNHEDVPAELAKIDIFVALSRHESFGVSILEASAAGRPVIVSDAEGLQEVTRHGSTGLIVPRENPLAAAEAMEKLVDSREICLAMGKAGRMHVYAQYRWEDSVQTMLSVYQKTIKKNLNIKNRRRSRPSEQID